MNKGLIFMLALFGLSSMAEARVDRIDCQSAITDNAKEICSFEQAQNCHDAVGKVTTEIARQIRKSISSDSDFSSNPTMNDFKAVYSSQDQSHFEAIATFQNPLTGKYIESVIQVISANGTCKPKHILIVHEE